MATVQQFIARMDAQKETSFDLMRIYLGVGLLVRGVLFLADTDQLSRLVTTAGNYGAVSTLLVHYIALAHFSGGLFMALGLLTRIAALIQIPILVGAVFFVHLGEGLLSEGQSLELSALVLVLLCLIAVHGSGPLSVDRYIETHRSQ
jgi:uncharacterized membrane protein YphA (DoxX/SURF4 family)